MLEVTDKIQLAMSLQIYVFLNIFVGVKIVEMVAVQGCGTEAG